MNQTTFSCRNQLRQFTLALLALTALPALAQDDARARELEALRVTVENLEKTLLEVRAKLSEMERLNHVAGITSPAPVTTAPLVTTVAPDSASSNYLVIAGQRVELPWSAKPFDPTDRSPIRDFDTFNDHQSPAPRPDNKPIDPALKGFIQLPGTETMIRFGGSARLDAIADFADNGNQYQFVPSSIPVGTQAGADGNSRSTLHAKGTRISFEARRPAGTEGRLRIFNENDFFDSSSSGSMNFRVRHFYGQAWNLLAGQTYSAFMDIDAWPDVVDYGGPNAMVNRRQAQVRYTPTIYEGQGKMHLIFSIEQPDSDLSTSAAGMPADAKTYTRTPDAVAGWRWEGKPGHLQVAGLFRDVGFESDAAGDGSVFGWGVNVAGALNLFEKDKLSWQATYGEGVARYINDLGGGDLDAALDDSGDLKALPVFATVVGYTHQWSEQFRSTGSYGYVGVRPEDSLGGFALENTHYTSVNLVWHPTSSFRLGVEYLLGFKETQNGADGDAHRINFVMRYDLVR